MKYGSLCSGIEAATVAWHPLGWEPAFFSDIEPFPRRLLAHHYPDVPLHGDMAKFQEWPDHAIDLLVGGTPCQSFSVAGLRQGLADPRGNLMLTFGTVAQRYKPRWIVWENVPGVLSSNGGRDFGTFLGMLGQLGYGVAYRVLDAQYVRVDGSPRAVPQRRRRVFVVGHLGDWRRAAAVLFEPKSLRGDTPPSRKTGQDVAPTIAARTRGGGGLGTDFDCDGGLIPSVANPLTARMHKGINTTMDEGQTMVAHALRGEGFDASEDGTGRGTERGTPIVPVATTYPINTQIALRHETLGERTGLGIGGSDDPAFTLQAGHSHAVAFDCKGTDVQFETDGSHPPLRSMGHNHSHQNAEGYAAVAIQERAISENANAGPDGKGWRDDGAAYTLEARQVPQAVAFDLRGRDGGAMPEGPHDTASIRAASGGSSRSYVAEQWAVRRLTPTECERLQGFPDNYTRVPGASSTWRDVDECEDVEALEALGLNLRQKGNGWQVQDPDGPRYKALGNSMAVNVMRWIGRRIEMVEGLDV
jgi:DNA (cytosine-5)-methyltransferase 1